MSHTALIVEDDPGTRHLLQETLASAGIASLFAETGAAMWRQLEHGPDLIILDLSLPDADGLELLRKLRRQSEIPVLIHSTRSDEIERIIGIEIGADDFLPKPCNMRELLARTRSLLRRSQQRSSPTGRAVLRSLKFGDWTLNGATRELVHHSGKTETLGVAAFALLSCMLERPFEPLSRDFLSRTALRRDYHPFDRIIDVHISHLRRLLGAQGDDTPYIKTLRAQGYIFVAAVTPVE